MMILVENLQYKYGQTTALNIDYWEIGQGEQYLILGKSGSGKSTLLHLLSGLLLATQGSVKYGGVSLSSLPGAKLDAFRASYMGLIFQKSHVISTLTVKQNLEIVSYFSGKALKSTAIPTILEQLDMGKHLHKFPYQLSEGELQRLSIARAFIGEPPIILADEPTASLDDQNAYIVLHLLQEHSRQIGGTLLIATHDQRIKDKFSKHYLL